MTLTGLSVRPIQPGDRKPFLSMWADFVVLAPSEPGNHAMGEINWARLMDPASGLKAIVASNGERLLGFTLYLAFPFTWSRGDACYLQDIFVAAESRGKGVAQSMIRHIEAVGREAGWFKIFWMTQPDNFQAQRLYEKIAERKDYLRYDLNICDP